MTSGEQRQAASHAAIRPSRRLVNWTVIAAIFALASVPFGFLFIPATAFAVALAMLVLIDWSISRGDPPPRLVRELPERLVKGRPAIVTYRLSWPSGGTVVILDELPADVGGDLLIERASLASGTATISREVIPLRRGTNDLGPAFVMWNSRLRFLRYRAVGQSGGTVAILPPASSPERRVALTHRTIRDELGMRPRPARGEGREFESLREYFPGDDPRQVDWRATARRGRLMVRQYQTERRHTVMVAVDTGRLMAARAEGSSKLDYALDCAIALARASQEFGDRVGFMAFDREVRILIRPRAGAGSLSGMVEASARLKAAPFEPNYRVLADTLAIHQKKRALIIVLTDFVEGSASRELESYLGVIARRHVVLLVALRDRVLAEIDRRDPEITRDRLYRRLALQDLVVEREAALARIGRFGAQTLDLDPAEINAPVLNRYLAVRQASLL
jgi:uncharacterized protein (DUF58 family)